MKYKVILYNNRGTSDVDRYGSFTFYTYNQAYNACIEWRNIDVATYAAYLWNGANWEVYNPIP